MPGNLHGYSLLNTSVDKIAAGRSAKIMEQSTLYVRCLAGCCPRLPKVSNRIPVAMEYKLGRRKVECKCERPERWLNNWSGEWI
jgi:hypothetical protein